MSEQQPEYIWAPTDETPKRGRVWLIVGLAVAAVAIAVAAFWLFLRPGAPLAGATPTSSASPSASSTPSVTPSAAPTAPSASPEPSETPTVAPPPVPDPDVDTFRGQVQGWLDDAVTGLDIVGDSNGQDAVAVIDALEDDAQRLADVPAPSSIVADWDDRLSAYAAQLHALRAGAAAGSAGSVDGARSALQSLRALVGL